MGSGHPTVAGFESVRRQEGTRVKSTKPPFLTWYRQYQHAELDRRLNHLKADREQYYVKNANRTRTGTAVPLIADRAGGEKALRVNQAADPSSPAAENLSDVRYCFAEPTADVL